MTAAFAQLSEEVSILAPPEGGAQPAVAEVGREDVIVSILAPPEGGAQLKAAVDEARKRQFQSSLRPKAERNGW